MQLQMDHIRIMHLFETWILVQLYDFIKLQEN